MQERSKLYGKAAGSRSKALATLQALVQVDDKFNDLHESDRRLIDMAVHYLEESERLEKEADEHGVETQATEDGGLEEPAVREVEHDDGSRLPD